MKTSLAETRLLGEDGFLEDLGNAVNPLATGNRKLTTRLRDICRAAREVVYGMATFEWKRGLDRQRADVGQLFMLVTWGELIGLPILPPYYTLRLLPYALPMLRGWKRGLARERDWTDLAELIEGID